MKKRTHKVIGKSDDHGTFNVFVGTKIDCDKILIQEKQKQNQEFEFSIVPLGTESFKHKLVDLKGKLICQNTEINCYLAMDDLITDNDNFKVVELTEKESEFYYNQNPPRIRK